MTNLKSLKLLDILPSSIVSDPQVLSMAKALDPELQSVSHDIREALIVSRIDELPEEVLNLLAWQWHVDFYEPEKLPVEIKRSLIKNSIIWHRKKGTLWAVKQILRDLGLEPKIREWFDIGSAPYTFGIDAIYKGNPAEIMTFLGDDTVKLLKLAVEMTKPVRAGMLYLVVIPDLPGLDPSTHGCRYDYCQYAHGFLPGLEFTPDPIENPIEPEITSASIITTSEYFRYPRWISWSGARYGDILPETGQRSASTIITSSYTDREAMEGYNTWSLRERWDDKSWPEGNARIGAKSYLQVIPIGCAAYGYARYDDLHAAESRYRNIPAPYKYDGSMLDSSQDTVKFMPIDEYSVIDNGGEVEAIVLAEAVSGETHTSGTVFENENLETVFNGLSLCNGTVAEAWEGLSASWDSDTWRPDRTWADKPPAVTAESYPTLTEVS
jgi:phage tail P2-like protein